MKIIKFIMVIMKVLKIKNIDKKIIMIYINKKN